MGVALKLREKEEAWDEQYWYKCIAIVCEKVNKVCELYFGSNADETGWSLLPNDLLFLIQKRLSTRLDILRLRSVCSSWRSSVPPFKKSSPLPLNIHFPIFPNNSSECDGRGYCLSESPIFFFLPPDDQTVPLLSESTKIWVVRVEEWEDGKLFHPVNPLSRFMTKNGLRNFPNELNLMNTRVFEVAKGFSLDFVNVSGDRVRSKFVRKVVVSALPYTPNGDDFTLAVIQREGKLGFMKLGDEELSFVDDPKKYHDVAYYKGKFYAVDFRDRTVVFGSGSGFEVQQVVPRPERLYHSGKFKYLVVSKTGLFMIHKYMKVNKEVLWCVDHYFDDSPSCISEIHLEVYKLNEEWNRWQLVDSLGDKVFFVGEDCNYCVSVQDFPELKGNCIYLLDTKFGDNKGLGDLCVNFGVYVMEDDMCWTLQSLKGHSKFFWPPPAWINSDPHPTPLEK